jgi:hypothetical protein
MKVAEVRELDATLKCVVDYVAKVTQKNIKPQGNSYVTNSLNILANTKKGLLLSRRMTSGEVLSKHQTMINSIGYRKNIMSFLDSIKSDSKELEYFDTLLDCFEGKYPIKLHEKIFNKLKEGSHLPKAICEDLETVRKGGNLLDNYVPIFKTKEDALLKGKVGDVLQVEGNKGVSIINKKGEVEELSMDRNSYFKLFPPVERFANVQPDWFGNCYEVTALNAMMENPQTREHILRSIDTISDKNLVKIKFPNSPATSFNPETVLNDSEEKYYSSGADGIKFIEYALGKVYEKDFIEYETKELRANGDTKFAEKLERLFKWNQSNELAKACKAKHKTTLGTNLREAGDAIVTWSILGLKQNETYEMGKYLQDEPFKRIIDDRRWANKYKTPQITSEDTFVEKIWSPEFLKTHLVEAYVGGEESTSQLSHWHSYRLLPNVDDKGNIKSYLIKDPHGIADKTIDFEDILTEIDSISCSQI